ncbi:MAG: hypothetical protein MRY83_16030 [Flavobacteriales bacterium]|nr:hypothetical protein [Flavobacteriales bacterium]
MHKSYIFLIILFCQNLFSQNEISDKKLLYQNISDQYVSNANTILGDFSASDIEKYCVSSDYRELINAYSTMIHEKYHIFNYYLNQNPSKRSYYIDDNLTVSVDLFDVFTSNQINHIVNDYYQDNIFRYHEYIDSQDPNMDSQKNGIFGIFEEFCAYYQDFLSHVEMYDYLKDNHGFEESGLWVDYLTTNGSILSSYYEFKLFISWYLQYAHKNYPEIYEQCTNSQQIKLLYTTIDSRFNKALQQYLKNRLDIMANLKDYVDVKQNFIGIKGENTYYSLPDKDLEYVRNILEQPEHQMLQSIELSMNE